MSRFRKTLVFGLLVATSGFASGFKLPSSSFAGIRLADDGLVIINQPSFYDGNANRPLSSRSNFNGVCTLFGYDQAVPSSVQTGSVGTNDEEVITTIIINNSGLSGGKIDNDEIITAIGCQGDIYERGGRYDRMVMNAHKESVIRAPMIADLRGGRNLLSAESDLQGICRLFGFNQMIPGTLVLSNTSSVTQQINNQARVAKSTTSFSIEAIGCTEDIGEYWPRVNLVEEQGSGVSLVIKPRLQGLPISYHSNMHDVCRVLGFDHSLGGIEKERVGDNVEVNALGDIVKTRTFGLGYERITCTSIPENRKEFNHVAPQGEGSILLKKPRIELDNFIMAEVSASSDHDGLCRHYGFSRAIQGTANPVFWQDGVKQVVVKESGNIESKSGFGLVISDIQCSP